MSDDRAALDAILRLDLASFVSKVYATVDASQPYHHNWHIEVLADHLNDVLQGRTRRLLITLPPRGLKSIAASVALPAFALGHDPTRHIICASYSGELAAKHARDTRAVMQTDWYRRVFPRTRLNPKKLAEEDFETTARGGRLATSVGGTLTGRGGNLIIIDDPIKPQEALSKPRRDAVKQWYDGTLYSRLDDKRDGAIIIIMQRVHIDDLAAHVLEQSEWTHLNLPAIAHSHEVFELADGRRHTRAPGEALHPDRESLHDLEAIRTAIGSYNFEAQYQQTPVPESGNLVQWEWIRTFDTIPPPNAPRDKTVQSWDTATTIGDGSDWSVCTTWAIRGNEYYLVDLYRERLDFPSLKRKIVELQRQYRADSILIEDVGLGIGMIQQLKEEGQIRPVGCKPEGSKADRMAAQSSYVEAGHVLVPARAPWLGELRSELLAFPHGKHDDQVDSISQFLKWRHEPSRGSFGIVRLRAGFY